LRFTAVLAPSPIMVRGRAVVDAETVKALFTNRLHVLRDYRRRVIRPVFRELKRREGSGQLARSDLRLLFRHPSLLDERGHQALNALLDRYEVLRAVLEFRDRLQQTWDGMSASHARALEHLRAVRRG
jgi:stearoyl-CoA desaturase (Delta-9 desaturase)